MIRCPDSKRNGGRHTYELNGPKSGKDITLTPENQDLMDNFVVGIYSALSCEAVQTYELTQEINANSQATTKRHLARAAIYRFSQEDDELYRPEFQVTLTLRSHQLNADYVQDISPAESEELPSVQSDGIEIQLLDYTRNNIHTWHSIYQRGIGYYDIGGVACGFDPSNPKVDSNPATEATGSGATTNLNESIGLSKGSLYALKVPKTIELVLSNGSVDIPSTERLVRILESRDNTKLLTMNRATMINANPHFRNILTNALSAPNMRDMFAWQQYCDEKSN
jgi:hypothetical protein